MSDVPITPRSSDVPPIFPKDELKRWADHLDLFMPGRFPFEPILLRQAITAYEALQARAEEAERKLAEVRAWWKDEEGALTFPSQDRLNAILKLDKHKRPLEET